jgi:drug/metabolite transporter (DMT)-like permease
MTALEKARNAPFQVKLIGAFAAVYIVWGSTYLAIRLVMESLPAFLSVGLRFLFAGLLMIGWGLATGAQLPRLRQAGRAGLVGVMLLFLGTGSVVWAAFHLNSGLLALLVAMEPLWLTLMLWAWPGGHRPTLLHWLGIAVGFSGAAVLAIPGGAVLAGAGVHLPSVVVLTIGCLFWAAGSLIGRGDGMPSAASWSSGLQMLSGGAALVLVGLFRGEWASFRPENATFTSVAAFIYMIVFGSLLAFSAYTWLMRNVDPTMVATHTFVNPVVAVFLGWWIRDEPVSSRTLVATGLIVVSVVFTIVGEKRRQKAELAAAATPVAKPEPRREVAREQIEACDADLAMAEAR